MRIDHAEAAVRGTGPDRMRLVGAVDPQMRILLALIKIDSAGTERIVGSAGHAVLVLPVTLRLACLHLLGRDPARPLLLVAHRCGALELQTLPSDSDCISTRRGRRLYEIKPALTGIDDNGAPFIAAELDHLRFEFGLHLERLDRK